MYGTHDAPMIWQDHLRKTLLDMKFRESVTHPGVFQHETRDILFCVHVDDLLCTGLRDNLMWLKKNENEYEWETMLMGADDDMEKKAVYLGRTVEWSENGLGARLDRTHVRSLLRELGMENCRSISTPLCATVEKEGHRSDRPEVSADFATKHRAAVARVMYLAQVRLASSTPPVKIPVCWGHFGLLNQKVGKSLSRPPLARRRPMCKICTQVSHRQISILTLNFNTSFVGNLTNVATLEYSR